MIFISSELSLPSIFIGFALPDVCDLSDITNAVQKLHLAQPLNSEPLPLQSSEPISFESVLAVNSTMLIKRKTYNNVY